jgi:Protein of unknown function (DUF4238)
MPEVCSPIWLALVGAFRSRVSLEAENVILRHQLNVLRRKSPKRPTFGMLDRLIFAGLYRLAPKVLGALPIVKPETVIKWHRAGFRSYWRWKSRRRGGRPTVAPGICKLKFIITDHPVTVYNREIFPISDYAKKYTDPDIRMNGTHTFFPLSPTHILILTNLSWARNPCSGGTKTRPNDSLFRTALFNFTDIQTGRQLDEIEVNQMNFIMKRRAERFIATAREEWLCVPKT